MKQKEAPARKLLTEVAAAEALRLADDPNIACVGIGLKLVKGKPTYTAGLQYFVRAKHQTADQIRKGKSKPVPAEVSGYPTDVIEWKIARPMACPGQNSPTGERGGNKEDPLVGGTSTTVLADFHSFPTGYGTLGGICFDAGSGDAMALSNAHVYGDGIGNDVIQPWLPGDDYLESALKYLFCGGPLSHLFFWTAPSPATAILTTLAAAAWTAAGLSDAEDPSRWGQRTGPLPPGGERTERESIRFKADVPHLPFPGRIWKAKTNWEYTRHTDGGNYSTDTTQDRPNEHVLVGKRVFTDRETYSGGDRVTICAELWSAKSRMAPTYFVVAHCFPIANPDQVHRRVLLPGMECARYDLKLDELRRPVCINAFNPQIPGVAEMAFPIVQSAFRLWCGAGVTKLDGQVLVIPKAAIHIACPPSTHARVEVIPSTRPVRVRAFSANGRMIAEQTSSGAPGHSETLELTGPEITRLTVDGGNGEARLGSICVDKRRLDAGDWRATSQYYGGKLDLPPGATKGKWGVVVVAQSMDNTPTGGDPIMAARRLGGIAASSNIHERGECACTILFDAVFDVV